MSAATEPILVDQSLYEAALEGATVHGHPAPIIQAGQRANAAELLALAQERAPDPSLLETNPPIFWRAQISSDTLDAYYTRMAESSLRNYAEDAASGVAFQDSHLTYGLDYRLGYSLTGEYKGKGNTGAARVFADFYTLAGLTEQIDRFTIALRAGLQRDVSIGFMRARYRCSICSRDMLRDWQCPHVPGRQYKEVNAKGEETGALVQAIAWVEDARLAEVSAVYKGATPGAAVLKLYRQLEAGTALKPTELRAIEARFNVRFGRGASQSPGVTLASPAAPEPTVPHPVQEETMTDERAAATAAASPTPAPAAVLEVDTLAAVAAALAGELRRAGAPEGAEVTWLTDEILRLRPLADDGRAYRADLVTQAMKEGVRAFGEGFAAETYRALLETAPLETVKRMLADWTAVATARWPGGRVTQEAPTEPLAAAETRDEPAPSAPMAAYR